MSKLFFKFADGSSPSSIPSVLLLHGSAVISGSFVSGKTSSDLLFDLHCIVDEFAQLVNDSCDMLDVTPDDFYVYFAYPLTCVVFDDSSRSELYYLDWNKFSVSEFEVF